MSARDMFEKLEYEYEYKKGNNDEDVIQFNKDNLHIQFNLTSKLVVFTNDSSKYFYGKELFMMNIELLQAINKQCEELGWIK